MTKATAAVQSNKKRHIDDDDLEDKAAEQKLAAATSIMQIHQEPSPPMMMMMPPRLCNGYLNLWLWRETGCNDGKPLAVEEEDSFDGLMCLVKKRSGEIEAVDVGVELWKKFKPEEVDQVLIALSDLPKLRWLQFLLRESPSFRSGKKKKESKDGTATVDVDVDVDAASASSQCRCLSLSVLHQILTKAKGLQNLLLKNLELKGTSTEWTTLVDAFKSHPSLWHLCLENYRFQEDQQIGGLENLIAALGRNPTLRVLEILCDDDDDDDEKNNAANEQHLPVTALKDLFRGGRADKSSSSSSMQIVRLCGLPLTDDHIVKMTESLRDCKTLQELRLWKTKITDRGAKALSGVLTDHPSLKKLNLNDNALLSARGCQAIFESLTTTGTTSTTATAVGTAKPKGRTGSNIEELYIGCRDMDDAGRSSLLELITKNRSIRKLEICFSWPKTDTVATLARFECSVYKAVCDGCGVLEYVRLYNDTSSSESLSLSDEKYGQGGEEQPSLELLWAIIWERPPKIDDHDEEDEE